MINECFLFRLTSSTKIVYRKPCQKLFFAKMWASTWFTSLASNEQRPEAKGLPKSCKNKDFFKECPFQLRICQIFCHFSRLRLETQEAKTASTFIENSIQEKILNTTLANTSRLAKFRIGYVMYDIRYNFFLLYISHEERISS